MYLTDEEKRMLYEDKREIVRKSMKILITLGEIYGAERLLKINNAHSPGVSYRVTGDAGLNFVKDASKEGCFKVPTTLNTIGIDSENWEKMYFAKDFALKQIEILDAYRKMGGISTYTCTPYLVGNIPMMGEHIAWGESSAVAYANSVLGARTNREGGPTVLAAAITGRVPEYGYHFDRNRQGKFLFNIDVKLKTNRDFAILGYFAGKIAGKEVPVFEGIKNQPKLYDLMSLSAALASSGAVALFHIIGITPEALTNERVIGNQKSIKFGYKEYNEVLKKFSVEGEIGLVVIGCPHCTINEFAKIAEFLSGKKVKSDFWVLSSRQVKILADKMGYTKIIEKAGAQIICDTCPVLAPTSPKGYRTLVTNSAKLAHYAPGLWNLKTGLLEIEDCVKTAIKGYWSDKK
ncbi:MAG: hypothetical protein DRH33_08115 [Candidatus Nealsonbacteria bacterium]|nr:MAG: hypothetical protein DRH33_08115 [Candidatus Nealsonbacteria bacterium]